MVLSLVLAGWVLATPPESTVQQPSVGVVFTITATTLREAPETTAKELARIPAGRRLVHRVVTEPGREWYRVSPPGLPAGWIPAADVSLTRPIAPAPPKLIQVVDSGTAFEQRFARPSPARASDWKMAKDHFLTLRSTVEKQFDDHADGAGNYPDTDVPGRKTRSEELKATLR